jgi:signal transduction histidine kinase
MIGFPGQKRAVAILAAGVLVLGAVLFYLAFMEAEREQQEQQRQAVLLVSQRATGLMGEFETRIVRLSRNLQNASANIAQIAGNLAAGEELISEVFLVQDGGRITFPIFRPVFRLDDSLQGSTAPQARHPLLAEAESLEFMKNDYLAAAAVYEKILREARSPDFMAQILNRIARCRRQAGQTEEAIKAYGEIIRSYAQELSEDRIPFGVLANFQLGSLQQATGNAAESLQTFFDLYTGLAEGEWPLTRDQFQGYVNLLSEKIESQLESTHSPEVAKRWTELVARMNEASRRAAACANIQQALRSALIPVLAKQAGAAGEITRFSKTIDGQFYFGILLPLPQKQALGLLINDRIFARKILAPDPGHRNRRAFAIEIEDRSEAELAGEVENRSQSGFTRLTYSQILEAPLPPWKINVYSAVGNGVRGEFAVRRNIYILLAVIVSAAIFFGGFMGIRSVAQQMELARLKSEFVATVSHELRTPLTSIRYMVDLLKLGRVREEDKRQQYYATLSNESDRLGRLIENILDFSRIEAGMKEYRFEETDTAQLTESLAQQFRALANQKGFTLATRIDGALPRALIDAEEISRALFNLVDNALKYSGTSREITFSAAGDEQSVSWQVSDQGIGIPEADCRRIFEKFYRSGSIADAGIRGSGIGLNLVKHIVDAHGGEVQVKSEVGKGTTVILKILVVAGI